VLPFDFVSKLTCDSCGHIETIRKPLKTIKQSETQCPQCESLGREAEQYFQIEAESEDADLQFSELGVCDRELLHYTGVTHQWSINIELFSELTTNTQSEN
jgi:fructose-1,6-bisphosphatase/sedoheptulose 1,7-bisphosphatase-like protein